jgi:hypothetical protein
VWVLQTSHELVEVVARHEAGDDLQHARDFKKGIVGHLASWRRKPESNSAVTNRAVAGLGC